MARFDLDGNEIKPLTICLIGGGGFIGHHLCEKLMKETSHKVTVIDCTDLKILHLLKKGFSWINRIEFHKFEFKYDSHLESLIKEADVTINLSSFFTMDEFDTKPLHTICRNFVEAIPVVKLCSESKKRLIYISTSEVYGRPIGSFLPKDDPLRQEHDLFIFKEDASPYVSGRIDKKRWFYACAKQLMERLIYGEAAENGLNFTIVRPFNWVGPMMDNIPAEVVSRVLLSFHENLLEGGSIRLWDSGESQHTFVYINDAIEAILLMIENPSRANGQIFNVGNPNNVATRKQLAEMMIRVHAKLLGKSALVPSTMSTTDISSSDFFGEKYDGSDKHIPDITIINRQLNWKPTTSLPDLLEPTLLDRYVRYISISAILKGE